MRQYLTILTGSLGAYDVNTTVKGVDKGLRLFSKWLTTNTLDNLGVNSRANDQESGQLKKEFTRLIKQESAVGYYSNYTPLASFEFLPWDSSFDTKVKTFKRTKSTTWEFLDAQLLSDYFSEQLRVPFSQKSPSFRKAHTQGMATTIVEALNRWQHHDGNVIHGIKVICSGKWQKTGDGRSQRISMSFGDLRKQSLHSIISYGSTATVTKFGVANIKVWIYFKSY